MFLNLGICSDADRQSPRFADLHCPRLYGPRLPVSLESSRIRLLIKTPARTHGRELPRLEGVNAGKTASLPDPSGFDSAQP